MPAASAAERLRLARLRAASTAFLRARPLLAGLVGAANGALLAQSGAPITQRRAVAVAVGLGVLGFAAEAWALRGRRVGERWLLCSLTLTVFALGAAAALTGAAASPLLPLLLAPAVVAVAAFEGVAPLAVVLGSVAVVLAGLLVWPAWGAPVAPPWSARMAVVSTVGALGLSTVALRALGGAHRAVHGELERLRQAAVEEAAARAREAEALGARVAHELRNPLSAVKALVQLAARDPGAPSTVERLAVVLGEIDRLERILTDYLSLARPLTAVEPEEVRLDALLAQVAALLEGRAADLGVRLEVDAAAVATTADPRRLREALINLCQNALDALAATGRGGVIRLLADCEGGGARVRVCDDGPGIEPGLRRALGRPFVEGRAGGTGLGVLLARSVARLHGGELTFEGAPGVGTVATLWLPPPGASPSPPAHADEP